MIRYRVVQKIIILRKNVGNTKNPELVLPAGNTESFYAALQAGANVVFPGLSQFNTRARASNFNQFRFLRRLKGKVLMFT